MSDRGDRGDRGISGERGPKGDHGQEGPRGVQGTPGRDAPVDQRGWFRRHKNTIAWICVFLLLLIPTALSLRNTASVNKQADHNSDVIKSLNKTITNLQIERHQRIHQQKLINCSLSVLVQASLQTGAFGAGIDPNKLSSFDLRVLATIAKVQAMSGSSAQIKVFKKELVKLKRRTDCENVKGATVLPSKDHK